MATYALTGADTLIINDRVINDFTDNTTITIEFPNDDIGASTGKNGNTIISENKQGGNANLSPLRILMNSGDDKFLNGLYIQQKNDLPTFPLINCSFTKRVGDGQGNVSFNTYTLLGGAFLRQPSVQENVNGDTEQGTVEYNIFFSQASRAIL